MDFLKKFWPHPFNLIKTPKKDVKPFVILLIIYAVIPSVFTVASGVVSVISPDFLGVGAILGLLGTLVSIYTSGGIVLSILKFAGVFDRENNEENKDDNNAQ